MYTPEVDADRQQREATGRPAKSKLFWLLPGLVMAGILVLFISHAGRGDTARPAIEAPPAPRSALASADAFSASPVAVPDTATWTQMRNVHFRIDETIALDIRNLEGEMMTRRPGQPIILGDKYSFLIRIHKAEVGLTDDALTDLMNRYVFAYPGAPIKNLRITTEGRQIRQKGTIHKGIDLSFEMLADLTVTHEGWLRLHPTSIKILGISAGGLMKTLGVDLDEVLDVSRAKGVRVEKNDLLLDPEHLLPAPAIQGRVTDARVEPNEVVQVFDTPGDALYRQMAQLSLPNPSAANYMFFRGGTLHFGKLYMIRTDLQIIDEDPRDPFDFYIDEYPRQLVAGYSKTQPDSGLVAFMPDFNQLGSASR